jgi:hypothetical protein
LFFKKKSGLNQNKSKFCEEVPVCQSAQGDGKDKEHNDEELIRSDSLEWNDGQGTNENPGDIDMFER